MLEVLIGSGVDLDVVVEPPDERVRALNGAVQVKRGLLLLSARLKHFGELTRFI